MWSLMPWKQNDNHSQSRSLTAEPFEQEFLRLRNNFDQLLSTLWRGRDGELSQFWGNSFDETDTHYVYTVAAPGFEPGDFDFQTSGDRLVVKAERKTSEDGQQLSRYSFGSLQRIVTLPAGAEKDGIEAQYRNGILELRIPKNPQAQNVKRIAVKSV